jgi:hypothetical protein
LECHPCFRAVYVVSVEREGFFAQRGCAQSTQARVKQLYEYNNRNTCKAE